MSAVALPYQKPILSLPSKFRRFARHEPWLFGLAVALVAAMAPTLFAMMVDDRNFLGINVWQKPLKFEIALAVYVLSLVFFARWLPAGLLRRRWYRLYIGAVIAAIVAEMIWIGGAAMFGTASHFNTTPIGTVIYAMMGAAATLLTSAAAVYAFQIARNSDTGLSPVLKESIVTGLGLVLPLTLIVAGTMSGMDGHLVGGRGSDAGGLSLMGWSRDGGDLRVAHFFATHALHAIPAFGLLCAWFWSDANRAPLRLFAASYVALVGFTFVQALLGRPFLPFA